MKRLLIVAIIISLLAAGLSAWSLVDNLGRKGIQGVGIAKIEDIDNSAVVTLTDGSYYVLALPRGQQGIPGIGINGITGKNGVDGKNGLDGKNGIQGINGIDGKDGIQGLTGATGPQGIQGFTGATGLTGLTGPQGIAGINGIDGTNGTNGVSVVGAHINCSCHLILEMSNGTTIDAGKIP